MNVGRMLIGLLVTALGALFLLDALDVLDAGRTIGAVWPVAIIAVGVVQLVERGRVGAGPLIVIGVGLLLLGSTTGLVPLDWSLLWPLALVGVGLWLLMHRAGPADDKPSSSENRVQTTALLSGQELRNSSRAFTGGSVTAVLGGVEIDLRDAQIADGGATLDLTVIMGGVELTVPEGWRVDIRATSILGGFDDGRRRTSTETSAPTLTLTGLIVMGGGDITN